MSASKKPVAKKRTQYREKGVLELPEWAKQDTTHKYRWVRKVSKGRSDGFDPRGWVVARDPEGETLEAMDTILTKMPLDEVEAMNEYKREEARNLIKDVMSSIEDNDARLRYEIEKLGGRIDKSTFSVDKKD